MDHKERGGRCATVLLRAERAIVRMMCGVKLRERKNSSELMSMAGLSEDIVTAVRKSRSPAGDGMGM